ncbi:MAG: hypothetical protein HFE48_07180 [Clostridia bacterium]|nr:hypothetical protein [Clostridia bacterium]
MSLKKILGIIVAFILMSFCQGCAAKFDLIDVIDGYDEIIGNISLFPDTDKDTSDDTLPEIRGWAPIDKIGYNEIVDFSKNSFAVAVKSGKKVIIDKNGKMISEATADLCEIICDKIIFKSGGYFGLKDIFGSVILSADYIRIDVNGDTVVAYAKENICLYYDGSLIAKIAHGHYDSVELYEDRILIVDGNLCDLHFQPLIGSEYTVISVNRNIAIIKDKYEKFGYYDLNDNKILITPCYFEATPFVNGYAQVKTTQHGSYRIIDMQGNTAAEFDGPSFGMYDGYIFTANGLKLDLYDSDFLFTGLSFCEVYSSRVFGGYIIDCETRRIYSVSERKYMTESFDNIIPIDNGFICKSADSYVLYDMNIEKAGEFPDAFYSGGILSVKHTDGKYYLYSSN